MTVRDEKGGVFPLGKSSEGISNLESLTIVILTLNRREQLRLSIEFWLLLPVKVVVVDGSESADEELQNRPGVKYVHSRGTYLENHGVAAEYVDTPYVIFSCDDELYVPSALAECVDFLNVNQDYVAVCGEAIGLHSNGSDWWWEEQYVRMRGFVLDNRLGADRVITHLSDYRVLAFCAVSRSDEWVRAWRMISEHEFSAFAASEIQFEASLVASGKVKVLPTMMWVRNRFIPPLWSEGTGVLGLDPSISFRGWWISEQTKVERELFIKTMVGIFKETLPRPERYRDAQLQALVVQAFSRFAGIKERDPWIARRIRRCRKRINRKLKSTFGRIGFNLNVFKSKTARSLPSQQADRPKVLVGAFDSMVMASLAGKGTSIDLGWLNLIAAVLAGDRSSMLDTTN